MNWDDARVFLAAARHGSLRGAGRALRLSQPTIGRRLAGFEAAIGGPPLFDRLPDGLRLTAAGEAMIVPAQQLEQAALTLERRGAAASEGLTGTVRISVGVWGAGFLVRHLAGGDDALPPGLLLELIESPEVANLARRDADLALRHRMPETGNLYTAKVGVIAAAVYRRRGTGFAIEGGSWINYPDDQNDAARWVDRQARASDGRIVLRASSLEMRFDAVRAGVGIGLLPCYSSDADPVLERLTPPIPDQDAGYWVSVHRDLRRTPRVRVVIDWIRQLFLDQRDALAGTT